MTSPIKRPSWTRGRGFWRTAVGVLALLLAPSAAEASFTIRATPAAPTVSAGGSVQVLLELEASPNQTFDLYGFDIRLDLVGAPTGVVFSAALTPATGFGSAPAPYIFAGDSYNYLVNPLDAGGNPVSFPATTVTLSDSPDLQFPTTFSVGSAGAVWTLGVLRIDTAASSTGSVTIQIDSTRSYLDTGVSDAFGNPVSYEFGTANGVLGVNGSPNAVPAPSGLVLVATATPFLCWFRRRQQRNGTAVTV